MPPIAKLFASFSGPEIFLEQGRLLFSVLHTFASAGVQIKLFDNLANKDLDKYGRMVYAIPGIVLTRDIPADPAAHLCLYDDPDTTLLQNGWQKSVQVRFDMFAPFWRSDPIIMPFPMHPLHSSVTAAQLEALRPTARRMRVFFSGDSHQYGRVWVRHPKTKLPRLQVVNAIQQRLDGDLVLVHDTPSLQLLLDSGCTNRCVMTASSAVRIEFGDWLTTLAKADFFICPPGIVMPMCHNIIEAMSVGTIPITNYPEWMDPQLEPGKNCLVFDGEDDLVSTLHQAMKMDAEQIATMQAAVIEYYERHLRPQTFVERILASPSRDLPILMYTERNMALNAKRLGRHSILMKGTNRRRPAGWLQRVLTSYLS